LRVKGGRVGCLGLCAASAAAAAVHFAVLGEHFGEDPRFGAFFVAAGLFQLAWAACILKRVSPRLLVAAGIGNALILGVWALSRTVGLPIGPDSAVPEPVGLPDLVASACEVGLVAGVFMLGGRIAGGRVRTLFTMAAVAVTASLPATVLASPTLRGRQSADGAKQARDLIGHAGRALGPHLIHLLIIGGAVLVFLAYLVWYMLANGWPSFSLRLTEPPSDRDHASFGSGTMPG
jgi:hypothetical protein